MHDVYQYKGLLTLYTMKRRANVFESDDENEETKRPRTAGEIREETLQEWRKGFYENPANILAMHAVTNVGADLSSTNPLEARKVSHVFLNSIKDENVKAANQSASGRCWLFSLGNMFRHNIIRAVGAKNFEYSMTYLFFYYKLESANSFLLEVKKTKDAPANDRYIQYIFNTCMEDGSRWNVAANLVDKYGLVPKEAMPETFQSSYSFDMNAILITQLHGAANAIRTMWRPTPEKIETICKDCMRQVYETLVKFLGDPPKKFDWNFYASGADGNIIKGMTPFMFKEMTIPKTNLSDDFVFLANYPQKPFYKNFEVHYSNVVQGGKPCVCTNLPVHELKKYAMKMLLSGIGHAVWFGANVGSGLCDEFSALDDKIYNFDMTFGKPHKLSKADQSLYKSNFAAHAMTFVGVDIDSVNRSVKWQVENSWGFQDNEEPGEDGFMTMSDQWFTDHVYEIVVHKSLLSRFMRTIVDTKPILLDPWDTMQPARPLATSAQMFYERKLRKKKQTRLH